MTVKMWVRHTATIPTPDPGCPSRWMGYYCTEDAGHRGRHYAHGDNDLYAEASWETDDVRIALQYGQRPH